ncbi:hypothetical protein ACFOY8_11945 [Thalassospira xianhensis]|uniref:Uncharacterized protein n=1 Tax=Thalassospira xianhensis MCCC 1A02616 TaxID=1177929 RepID=A0A367U8V9_9PROT|nr:hypothetical protein [Thalassospira xianhensis]RCK04143.1 hypothetical protein TH5_21425 [Thalassospira xianhensis MCCC 1A02616]
MNSRATYFHVSKVENRTSIQRVGLIPQIKEFTNIKREPGIYLLATIEQARDWAFFFAMDVGEPVDIWMVTLPDDVDVRADPDQEMNEVYDSFVCSDAIPAPYIERVGFQHVESSTAEAPPLASKIGTGTSPSM